jgi:hypothetical protein
MQNHPAAFTNNYVLDMYSHYLEMYQLRYSGFFPFIVTWQHISYWRHTVTFLGNIAIRRQLITKQQYLSDKKTVYGNPATNLKVKQSTVDSIDEILQQK